MKQKIKQFEVTKYKRKFDQLMSKEVYFMNNIIFEIHLSHFVVSQKSNFHKIEYGFMNVYKTLYMQSAISSLLQDCIHNMNNKLKFNIVHVLWQNQ
jgi:hypothetical protein